MSREVFSGGQAVNDDFNAVPHLPVEMQILGQLDNLSIDPRPDITLFEKIFSEVSILTFLALYDRGQNLKSCTSLNLRDRVDNLLDGLSCDRAATFVTVLLTDPGKKGPAGNRRFL